MNDSKLWRARAALVLERWCQCCRRWVLWSDCSAVGCSVVFGEISEMRNCPCGNTLNMIVVPFDEKENDA